MKRVIAKRWLNVNGDWHQAGDTFEVESLAGIADAVEVVSEVPEEAVKETVTEEKKPEKVEEEPKAVEEKPVTTTARRRGGKASK